jgi:hypothetical protein
MSLATIKDEAARFMPAERDELTLQLKVLKDLEDPASRVELTQVHAEAERRVGSIDREELPARLGAARHAI